MYSNLIDMVNAGKYQDVLVELEKFNSNEYTEELTIIAASALLAVGNYEKAREYLEVGLRINNQSDELYLLLGNYYEQYNLIQAYLCYENAELYCQDMRDKDTILSFKRRIDEKFVNGGVIHRNIAIILLCFSLDRVKHCIESIRKNNISCSYEIVVVYDESMDESLEWLERQKDVILIRISESIKGSNGYNQGIKVADPEADILLMNSDMELSENSLFWLRMALYEDEKIGAVGSRIYRKFVQENGISIKDFYESKFYLDKSAIVIRREALNEIGLLNVCFKQDDLWENDFGLRLFLAGWNYVLCHNSCIYYSEMEEGKDASAEGEFGEKWVINNLYDADISDELTNFISENKNDDIYILQVGCDLNERLRKIQVKYPNSQIYGIDFFLKKTEINSEFLHIVRGDFEKFRIPFGNKRFDYIILSGVLKQFLDPEKVVEKLLTRLKSNGSLLCSIPNFMNLSILYSLAKNKIEYEDRNILNNKYFKFFNLKSIRRLFDNCEMYIDKLIYKNMDVKEVDNDFLEFINEIFKKKEKKEFLAQQYIFRVRASHKNFKITAVGLIKNAADVIETYIRANGLLVDNFVLLDNMCSDRTIPILERLRQEGFDIEIIRDDIIEHNQSEKMNKLIYYVNEKYHPDFIIPVDDDEFVIPSSGKDTIERVRYKIARLSQKNLYYLKWKVYVPTKYDDYDEICVAKRQLYCCEDTEETLNKVIIPGKILEDGTFSIINGNHSGNGNLVENHIMLSFVRMAHFPCRSEEQLRSKVLTGWTNCLAFPGRRKKDATQWKHMYLIAKKGNKLSLRDMQLMAATYASSPKLKYIGFKKEPVNISEEAMIIEYTGTDEVNSWENYCTNVEILAQKYAELLEKVK